MWTFTRRIWYIHNSYVNIFWKNMKVHKAIIALWTFSEKIWKVHKAIIALVTFFTRLYSLVYNFQTKPWKSYKTIYCLVYFSKFSWKCNIFPEKNYKTISLYTYQIFFWKCEVDYSLVYFSNVVWKCQIFPENVYSSNFVWTCV